MNRRKRSEYATSVPNADWLNISDADNVLIINNSFLRDAWELFIPDYKNILLHQEKSLVIVDQYAELYEHFSQFMAAEEEIRCKRIRKITET